MALATVADVLRMLNQTGTTDPLRDASIASALQAAEEWVRRYLRWDPDQTGTQTLKFYDWREDALLPLPHACTVAAVRVYTSADATAETLTSLTDYEVIDRNRLRLRSPRGWPQGGSTTDDWTGPGRLPQFSYERIEVDITLDDSCASVPSGVVTGTAMIAGALYQRTAAEMQGITSENIGGYSYSLASAVTGGSDSTWIPRGALFFLRPHRKRTGVFVT